MASVVAPVPLLVRTLAVLGALIGAIALSGSVIAWAKLDGRMDRRYVFPGQQALNLLVFAGAAVLGGVVAHALGVPVIVAFFVAALAVVGFFVWRSRAN